MRILEKKPDSSQQAQRLIFMLKLFQKGKEFSVNELRNIIHEEFNIISIRSVQRDLALLQKCEPALLYKNIGRVRKYYIPRRSKKLSKIIKFNQNDTLSLYILKSYLKTFKGTLIDDEASSFEMKLNRIAPGDVLSNQSLLWDNNLGSFDYTDYDDIIYKIIQCISNNSWVNLSYMESNDEGLSEFNVLLRTIIINFGYLYVVAYNEVRNSHRAFSVHRISEIHYDTKQHSKPMDFDYNEFIKDKFGVTGDKTKRVRFIISKDYEQHFKNRFWHPSQQYEYDENNNLILTLRVPLNDDFIAWILNWSIALKVDSPVMLRNIIKKKAKDIYKMY